MITFLLAAVAAVQPVPAIAPALRRSDAHDRAAVAGQVEKLFARIDTNRDGFVTREEAEGARAMHKQSRRQGAEVRHRAPDPARQQQRRMAAFDRMDSNRDGSVSRAEFAQASAVRVERRIRHVRGDVGRMGWGARMFETADANRDGRVSIQEATAAAHQRFDMADIDRDGRLTREERIQLRERLRGAQPRG